MDEANESAHGDWSNTPSDETYGEMITEERTEHNNIENAAYKKYIGAEEIMDVPGEVRWRDTVRRHVENLDGAKVETYHCNSLMDNWEYKFEYDDEIHDRDFANVNAENLY